MSDNAAAPSTSYLALQKPISEFLSKGPCEDTFSKIKACVEAANPDSSSEIVKCKSDFLEWKDCLKENADSYFLDR